MARVADAGPPTTVTPVIVPPRRRVDGLARAMRGHRGTVVALVVLLALFLLPLRGLLRSQGPPMEEGFMLTFPQRVLRGELPNADFLHLYGPGSVWVLAGFFKVFGDALVDRARRRAAAADGPGVRRVHAGPPLGPHARHLRRVHRPDRHRPAARTGGAGMGGRGGVRRLGAVVRPRGAPAVAVRPGEGAPVTRSSSGLLAGAALLYRPDLIVALTRRARSSRCGARARHGCGGRCSSAPRSAWRRTSIHLATAGLGAAFRGMVLDPVIYLRGGRRLPIPPNPVQLDGFLQRSGDLYPMHWPVPALTTAAQLTAWFFLLLARGRPARPPRRAPRAAGARARSAARVLLAVAVFCVGILPQGVQRTDSAHFAWASCVSLGFLPVALYELLGRRRWLGAARPPAGCGARRGGAARAADPALLRAQLPRLHRTRPSGARRLSFRVHYNGRTFYYGRSDVQRGVAASCCPTSPR